jgi:hypothetical protein
VSARAALETASPTLGAPWAGAAAVEALREALGEAVVVGEAVALAVLEGVGVPSSGVAVGGRVDRVEMVAVAARGERVVEGAGRWVAPLLLLLCVLLLLAEGLPLALPPTPAGLSVAGAVPAANECVGVVRRREVGVDEGEAVPAPPPSACSALAVEGREAVGLGLLKGVGTPEKVPPAPPAGRVREGTREGMGVGVTVCQGVPLPLPEVSKDAEGVGKASALALPPPLLLPVAVVLSDKEADALHAPLALLLSRVLPVAELLRVAAASSPAAMEAEADSEPVELPRTALLR